MHFHGSYGDVQLARDSEIGSAFGDEREDLAFSGGESVNDDV